MIACWSHCIVGVTATPWHDVDVRVYLVSALRTRDAHTSLFRDSSTLKSFYFKVFFILIKQIFGKDTSVNDYHQMLDLLCVGYHECHIILQCTTVIIIGKLTS